MNERREEREKRFFVPGFYVGSSIVRRASAVHMVIVIIFIVQLSPFTVPNFPYFSKGIFSFVDRKMRLFVFSNGFASEIFLSTYNDRYQIVLSN